MKKFAIVAAAVLAFGLTSCSKDYNCSCTYNNGVSDTTTVTAFVDAKKADAEEACDALQTAVKLVDASGTCTLD